jgi:hypothetical protein
MLVSSASANQYWYPFVISVAADRTLRHCNIEGKVLFQTPEYGAGINLVVVNIRNWTKF